MKDDETITFNKKEIKLILEGIQKDYIEWVLLPSLDNIYFDELVLEEKETFKSKLQKMCLL